MHSLLPSHKLQRHSNGSVRFPPPAGASACRLPHQHSTRLSTEDTPFFFKAPAPVVIRASELHSPFSHHKAGQPSCGAFTSVSSLSSSSYSAWPAPRYSLVLVTLRISSIEGVNWRHGDIEDMLKKVACLKGHKWTSMMIKRVYFG